MLNHDLLADLPPPRDDEPPSLRSDILDELTDHLQCAFRREVLKDGDETAAEARVLDRFGDPKKLARRLWWQAMWSRIMGKQILSGLQWLVSLAAVTLAAGVFWQQSQILTEMNAHQQAESNWRQNLSLTLNDLKSRLPAPAASVPQDNLPGFGLAGDDVAGAMSPMMGGGAMAMGPGAASATTPASPTLTVKLVQATADGPPVTSLVPKIDMVAQGNRHHPVDTEGAQIQFTGQPGGMMQAGVAGIDFPVASRDGKFSFSHLQPDRYELQITLEDGQKCTQPVLILDEKPRELTIVCPGPRKRVPVLMIAPPVPDDLQSQGYRLVVGTQVEPLDLQGTKWQFASWPLITAIFDPQTGQAIALEETEVTQGPDGELKKTDLSQTKNDERLLFLLTGPIRLSYALVSESRQQSTPVTAFEQPRLVQPSENRWELQFPEGLLDAARKLPETSPPMAGLGRGKTGLRSPGGLGMARAGRGRPATSDDESNARLIIKLTTETKDGPPTEGVAISLHTQQGETIRDRGIGVFEYFAEQQQWTATVPPGRHAIRIELTDGQRLNEKLPLLRPGQERELHIVCPPPLKQASVLLKAPPVPADLRDQGFAIRADFYRQPVQLEGRNWFLERSPNDFQDIHHAKFDPETGAVLTASQVDFANDPPEDRVLLLRTGTFHASYRLIRKGTPGKTGDKVVFTYPTAKSVDNPDDPPVVYDFTLNPGDNTWNLNLDDFWSAARKADLKSEGQPTDNPDAPISPIENSSATEIKKDTLSLTVKLVQETEDGAAVTGAEVFLERSGKRIKASVIGEKVQGADRLFRNTGKYVFKNVFPDQYKLVVRLADGRHSIRAVEINGDSSSEITMLCPAPQKSSAVWLTIPPLPKDLQTANCFVRCQFWETGEKLGKDHWSSGRTQCIQHVTFDPLTGQVVQIDDSNLGTVDLREMPAEDRAVTLPCMPLHCGFFILRKPDSEKTDPVFVSPRGERQQLLHRDLKPDETRWALELPEELIAEARKSLAELDAEPAALEPDNKENSNPSGNSPGAKTESPKKSGEQKLTLVTHTNGEPTAGVQVRLYNREPGKVLDVVGHGVSDAAGQVSFAELPAGRYTTKIYAPQIEMRTDRILDWDAKAPTERVIALPTELFMTDLKLTTNLPQAAVDAGLRVCVQFKSPPLSVREGGWQIRQESFESLVVGGDGIEGRLLLPKIHNAEAQLMALLNGQHRIETVSQANLKLPVFPPPLEVVSLGLICPASDTRQESDAEVSPNNNWLVCAWTQSLANRLQGNEGLKIQFQLKKSDTNEWKLKVPDEMIALARSRLAKAEQSSANGAVP